MFILHDQRSGQAEPLSPGRPGTLYTQLNVGAGARADAGDLRSCLVADLIRRVGEHHGLRVSTWQAGPAEELASACEALNIHPTEAGTPPVPGRPDVVVAAGEAPMDGAVHWVQPGKVSLMPASATAERDGGPLLAVLAGSGIDPLALRLALLETHYREPAALDSGSLTASFGALRGWRGQVAEWADSPSKPMCSQYVGSVIAALDSDIGTPQALSTVRTLASDPDIPAGSKFEMFAYLDRFLGLDLARDVGR